MDSFSNASVSGCFRKSFCSEMSPNEPVMEQEENDDVSLEWLSIFMEDCLSGNTSFSIPQNQTPSTNPPPPQTLKHKPSSSSSSNDMKFSTKTKTKRRKLAPLEEENTPLLPQTYWLAESELILPKKDFYENNKAKTTEVEAQAVPGKDQGQVQPRKCTHCLSQKTPQWRAGPLGPKTLCNACGVRFKSGRLLPEYRPAKSPTFVSCKHSNSHKKVMEMRMAIPSNHFGLED
ncbi:GATA transcription factor 12-like [Phalaenopsis equestris]|uniref:GATA transcription factor 12-like n=1 Tax=Phalaenopsis equestris TaxID=78828 RepID=UPI0009E5A70C|nr:GATA transcription factor 12-like [Phalaenopsis equestris]